MINSQVDKTIIELNANHGNSSSQAINDHQHFQRFWAVGEKSYFSLIIATISVAILVISVPLMSFLGGVGISQGYSNYAPGTISLMISWMAFFVVVIATIYKEYNQKNYFQFQCQVFQNKSEAMIAYAAHDSTKVSHHSVITPMNRVINSQDVNLQASRVLANNQSIKKNSKTVQKYWKRHLFYEHIADGSFSIAILFFTVFVILKFGL